MPSAEACSTTEDGDEPLHCPTGYECHIINPGNPAAGIPNRGQCIKQRGNSGTAKVMLITLKLLVCVSPTKVAEGADVMNDWIMLEIKQLLYFYFGSIALTDGRGLRHKYFKDYKDYLGK